MISIIVPVYKVEEYLRRCIDSILSQTYKDFELILVDDGSPDNCGAICDEYAQKDSRITVIHKENGGLSSARNAGLEIAKGDYIGFVDSDDEIAPRCYEALHYFMETDGSDIVTYNHNSIPDTDKWIPMGENRVVVDSETVLREFSDKYYKMIGDTVMTKLYKKKIFNNLRFKEGIIYEDAAILPYSIKESHRITVLPFSFYFYTFSEGSIMRSSFSSKRFDILPIRRDYIDFFDRLKMYKQRDAFSITYLYKFVDLHRVVYTEHRELKKDFKPYEKDYNRSKKVLRNCHLSKAQRIMMEVLPWFPVVSYKLYDKLIK